MSLFAKMFNNAKEGTVAKTMGHMTAGIKIASGALYMGGQAVGAVAGLGMDGVRAVKKFTGDMSSKHMENIAEGQELKQYGKGSFQEINVKQRPDDYSGGRHFEDIERGGKVHGKSKWNEVKSVGKSEMKGLGLSAAIGGAMYGLSAYMTDDESKSGGDRMAHYARHGVAAGVDLASDALLTGVGAIASLTLGAPGAIIAGGITAFNIGAGFMGMDAGSLAMNFMNQADEEYDLRKQGTKFNMTQNTSMAMQRQIQNLHASGSNLGEAMHN